MHGVRRCASLPAFVWYTYGMNYIEKFNNSWELNDNGCWIWQPPPHKSGYGRIGTPDGTKYAHIFSYVTFVGPVPPGAELDHRCRVHACVNYEHLEAVTHRENMLRGDTVAARNAAKTHCPRNHAYTGDNLVIDGGGRRCRTCKNERQNERRWAKRATTRTDPKSL